MAWLLVDEQTSELEPRQGKFLGVINLDMVCQIVWDEEKQKKIGVLANGQRFDWGKGLTADSLDKALMHLP
jgi:hypothetical protein